MPWAGDAWWQKAPLARVGLCPWRGAGPYGWVIQPVLPRHELQRALTLLGFKYLNQVPASPAASQGCATKGSGAGWHRPCSLLFTTPVSCQQQCWWIRLEMLSSFLKNIPDRVCASGSLQKKTKQKQQKKTTIRFKKRDPVYRTGLPLPRPPLSPKTHHLLVRIILLLTCEQLE